MVCGPHHWCYGGHDRSFGFAVRTVVVSVVVRLRRVACRFLMGVKPTPVAHKDSFRSGNIWGVSCSRRTSQAVRASLPAVVAVNSATTFSIAPVASTQSRNAERKMSDCRNSAAAALIASLSCGAAAACVPPSAAAWQFLGERQGAVPGRPTTSIGCPQCR